MSRIIQGGSKWFRLPSTVDFWQDSLTVQFGMQGAAWFQSSPGSNDLTSIFVGLADKKQRCLTFHWHPGLLGKAHLPLEGESLTENLNQNHIMGIKTLSQKWCSKNQNLTSTLEAGWIIFFYHICTPLPWNQLEFCFWSILPANLKNDKRLVFFFGVSWRHQSSPGWDAIAIGFGHWSYAETCQCTGGTAVSQPRWANPYPLKVLKVEGFWRNSYKANILKTLGGWF